MPIPTSTLCGFHFIYFYNLSAFFHLGLNMYMNNEEQVFPPYTLYVFLLVFGRGVCPVPVLFCNFWIKGPREVRRIWFYLIRSISTYITRIIGFGGPPLQMWAVSVYTHDTSRYFIPFSVCTTSQHEVPCLSFLFFRLRRKGWWPGYQIKSWLWDVRDEVDIGRLSVTAGN